MNAEQIIAEVLSCMSRCPAKYPELKNIPRRYWFVGITSKNRLDYRLFREHRVNRLFSKWVYCPAEDLSVARIVQQAFLDSGCDGAIDTKMRDSDHDPVFVYAFEKTPVTTPADKQELTPNDITLSDAWTWVFKQLLSFAFFIGLQGVFVYNWGLPRWSGDDLLWSAAFVLCSLFSVACLLLIVHMAFVIFCYGVHVYVCEGIKLNFKSYSIFTFGGTTEADASEQERRRRFADECDAAQRAQRESEERYREAEARENRRREEDERRSRQAWERGPGP